MLRRMRWLLLSLLIVYFWFTPGQPCCFATTDAQGLLEQRLSDKPASSHPFTYIGNIAAELFQKVLERAANRLVRLSS